MSANKIDFSGSLIICLCEGSAEMDVMNLLLEHDRLRFPKEQLFDKKVRRRKPVQSLNEDLNYDFSESTVYIMRIIDSRSEKFKLAKVYEDRGIFKVITCLTRPEIEVLIAINEGDYDKCMKSSLKPSDFCKASYGFKKLKSKGFMESYFGIDRLVAAIKEHKRHHRGEDTIYDLLKDEYR